MDSTISVQPGEAPDSLHRARRAAWGSFAGAVVDWYDFLLYGITAALVFNREFFPQIGPAMGTLAAFATFGVGFLFRPLGGIIFGSSRMSGEGGFDLQKEVISVAVSVSHALDHFDLVVDPFKLAGMHRPAHSRQDASPVRFQR
ncbi:shikimate transporter [Klebsiella pneumoniae]|nr:shikimate transporter [Klebsiella pneumoniae]